MSVYYKPEEFCLTIVGEAFCEPNYDFDMFVVWKDYDGGLYYAEDTGCSCPSPFEDYTSIGDLDFAETESEVHEALNHWADSRRENTWSPLDEASVADLHLKLASISA